MAHPKYSEAQARHMLKVASTTIVNLAEENHVLRTKVAQMQQRERSVKLAEQMHSKGIDVDMPLERLADNLDQMAGEGKFAEWERAVEMVAPDMGVGMALRGEGTGTASSDSLTAWLSGQID